MTEERPPRGRPRIYRKTRWKVTMMLSAEVVAAIDTIAHGNRSAFIDEWLRTHPQVAEHLAQQQKENDDA